jgi:hypothetical protein
MRHYVNLDINQMEIENSQQEIEALFSNNNLKKLSLFQAQEIMIDSVILVNFKILKNQ